MNKIEFEIEQQSPDNIYDQKIGTAGKWYVVVKGCAIQYLRPDLTIKFGTGFGIETNNVGWWDTEEEAKQVVAAYYAQS